MEGMRNRLRKAIRQAAICSVIMFVIVSSAWAASIEGEEFLIKPWLSTLNFTARGGCAVVKLGYQIDNPSALTVRIRGMHLKCEVISLDPRINYNKFGTIKLEQTGAPPFDEIMVWPHASTVHPIADAVIKPAVLTVPRGTYSYIVSLIDPTDSNRVISSSNVIFEVN